jgi:NDP-sugar pyrophosphorylase family protein
MAQPLPLTDGVILAGGLGTRLHGVVDGPKVLAQVAGRPFLEILLAQLGAAGVTNVLLCTGHKAEQFSQFLRKGVRESREPEPRGTGGALRHALEVLPERFFVLNGDSYCDADLQALAALHVEKSAAATLLCTRVPDTARFGAVVLDGDGRVQRFEEKGRSGPGAINAGIYVIEREVVAAIPAGRAVSLERETFPSLGGRLYGRAVDARFIDIGTPDSFAEAQRFFA